MTTPQDYQPDAAAAAEFAAQAFQKLLVSLLLQQGMAKWGIQEQVEQKSLLSLDHLHISETVSLKAHPDELMCLRLVVAALDALPQEYIWQKHMSWR